MFKFNSSGALAACLAAALGLGAGPALSADARLVPQPDFAAALKLKAAWVEATVKVRWSDESPVVGAKVFDHRAHRLLGQTDTNGVLIALVPNGTLLRIVDPNYGQQQAMHLVQGKKQTDTEMRTAAAMGGSGAMYTDTAAPWWEIF